MKVKTLHEALKDAKVCTVDELERDVLTALDAMYPNLNAGRLVRQFGQQLALEISSRLRKSSV